MSEKWKYDEVYDGRNPHYGKTNHGKNAYDLIPRNPISLLDIGCGYNDFIISGEWSGYNKLIGVDFACPGANIVAEAKLLPCEDKEFIWVTAFDVLEHIPEYEIDATLIEFRRVAQCYCFSISYRDSGTRASDGSTLHPTVKPEEWWINKISNYGTVTKIDNYLIGVFINNI